MKHMWSSSETYETAEYFQVEGISSVIVQELVTKIGITFLDLLHEFPGNTGLLNFAFAGRYD